MSDSFARTRVVPSLQTRALVALVAVTAVWGSTSPLLKGALDGLPAADLLTVRFGVATLALLALRPTALVGLSRPVAVRAGLLGVLYGVAQMLQTIGLEHTSASVSGFVTSACVVLTPVLGALLLRRQVPAAVWFGVALSTVGIGVLSLRGLALGPGETLTLVSAVFYALHILALGVWSSPRDLFGVSIVQLAVVTAVCAVAAAPGGLTVPTRAGDLASLAYLGVVAGAGTVLAQTWAQGHLAPERAAIVMTLEPVWAAGFAVALLSESLGVRELVGGGLVLAAMVVCERLGADATTARTTSSGTSGATGRAARPTVAAGRVTAGRRPAAGTSVAVGTTVAFGTAAASGTAASSTASVGSAVAGTTPSRAAASRTSASRTSASRTSASRVTATGAAELGAAELGATPARGATAARGIVVAVEHDAALAQRWQQHQSCTRRHPQTDDLVGALECALPMRLQSADGSGEQHG